MSTPASSAGSIAPWPGAWSFYIGPTEEGYAKVKSTTGYYTKFETRLDRLYPF